MLKVEPLGKRVYMMEYKAVAENELALVCQHLVKFSVCDDLSGLSELFGSFWKDPSIRQSSVPLKCRSSDACSQKPDASAE